MNDLNLAGLIAARHASAQSRQATVPERAPDPRDAASAFDAAMARATRNEAARGGAGNDARNRPADASRSGESKPAPSTSAREPQRDARDAAPVRDGEHRRTQPESGDETKSSAPAAQAGDAAAQIAASLPVTAQPVATAAAPIAVEGAGGEAPQAGTPAAAVAGVPQPAPRPAAESELEQWSTVIRTDDPLADAVSTPRGLARAMTPVEDNAARAAAKPDASHGGARTGADAAVRAAPFERLVGAMPRDVVRDPGVVAAADRRGASEAAAIARVDAGASLPSFAPIASNLPTVYSVAHGSVTAGVGQPAFAEEFAQRVVMFAGQRVQSAQIALSPAELGPIAISIEMRGQEAHLSFNAAHATTRAAIEDALPRLRDMLAASGLQLANAHVGDQAHRNPSRSRRDGDSPPAVGSVRRAGAAAATAAIDTQAIRAQWLRSDRLIDIVV